CGKTLAVYGEDLERVLVAFDSLNPHLAVLDLAEEVSAGAGLIPSAAFGNARIPDHRLIDRIHNRTLLVVVTQRAIPDVFACNLLDAQRSVFSLPFWHTPQIGAVGNDDIHGIIGKPIKPRKMMFLELRPIEAEPDNPGAQVWQFHRAE